MAGDQQAHETAAVRALRALGRLIDSGRIVAADDSRHACVLVSVRYDDLMATMHSLSQCYAPQAAQEPAGGAISDQA
jgi:hypothetical protein